jgi:tetrahydromethanopterin S-methyltransferase subunit C
MHSATVRFVTELTQGSEVNAKAARLVTLVFVVTSLGAFMGSLDLSIVNIAFPALEKVSPVTPRPR